MKLPNGKKMAITCPECGVGTHLIVRTNRSQGHQFLGCENWPDCNYTRSIPESIRMEAAGQPRLL